MVGKVSRVKLQVAQLLVAVGLQVARPVSLPQQIADQRGLGR